MPFAGPRALELLRAGTGISDSQFRDGQSEAIEHIVNNNGRLLVVQKTGWGKSLVYFIAVKMLREEDSGPALLVSPLLSLMRNQIAAATRMGLRAYTINSDNQEAWSEVEDAIRRNEVDILLISPERFANQHFRDEVLSRVADKISLLVVDEAHCISDWGHDFRPHYRLLERIVRQLPENLRVLATTATANNRVMDDLRTVLGPNLTISRGDLNRPSLALQTIRMPSQAGRLAWLAARVPSLSGSGIIYTLTVRDAEMVASWLKSRGVIVEAYTGETGERRPELEQALLNNEVKALVATTALGMGFDKPDLAFVIHFQTPGSVVAYYQQVGRAGRALDAAYGILLSGKEEADINSFFVESAFPTRHEVELVLRTLESANEGLSVPELMSNVNLSKGRIEKTIALLSLESPAPIVRQDSKWQLTAAILSEEFWKRAERLTDLRRREQAEMQRYVDLQSGHMEFLIRALDGEPGPTTQPPLPPLPVDLDQTLVNEAITFLKRSSIPFEPRKLWPAQGMPTYRLLGRIRIEHRPEEGRALSIWGDAGWGDLVRLGKYIHGRFSDDLVDACEQMIRQWNPDPAPTWVTCIPSLRHPTLVPDLAQRLSLKLGLPFRAALVRSLNRPEQKTMENSIQQARNVDGSLEVNPGQVLSGPVLLVDDMVDSRWTLTVGAWILRSNGSGKVFPVALALTGYDK